jgi:hypothetical protein
MPATTLDPVTQFQQITKVCLNNMVQAKALRSSPEIYGFYLDNYLNNIIDQAMLETEPDLENNYVNILKAKMSRVATILTAATGNVNVPSSALPIIRSLIKQINNPVTTTTTTTVAP